MTRDVEDFLDKIGSISSSFDKETQKVDSHVYLHPKALTGGTQKKVLGMRVFRTAWFKGLMQPLYILSVPE
ncbi:hypothetical protein TNCT_27671 [Trichonephila clavata]|uniref:Uncharacterized protein n=1 Tax=Trichonephila clavata TaxID=2740835 RepID=A0A8X6FAY5_TRICU|nr:hypothetical protein TNCT_27671 [Trichonephila clavata]